MTRRDASAPARPSFLLATSAVLAAILIGWTLPPGVGAAVLLAAVTVGVLVRELLRSHLHGLERLARARHREQGVAR